MRTFAALLALVAFAANAAFDPANPCNLPIPPPPVLYTDFLSQPSLPCAPWPLLGVTDDTSTLPVIHSNPQGMVAYWYCKRMAGVPAVWLGDWSTNISAVTAAELAKPGYLSSLAAAVTAAAAASNPSAALNAIAVAHVNTPMNDPTVAAVWCPEWPAIFAGAPPNRPPPAPVHAVLGTTTYLYRSGALVPLLSKAKIGATCSCPVTPVVVGGLTYCTFAGAISPSILAQCS